MSTDFLHIVNGCRNQDRLMQKALYSICYKDMMKLCYRYTNDKELAASVFNDAMIKVFKSIASYQEDGKLMAWIKKIVVNSCIDHVRKKAPFETRELNDQHAENNFIENEVFQKMSNADIRQLINHLPYPSALVFKLYVYEEYNHNEIADILKIPTGTSRYYLSEARRMLRAMVSNNIFSLNKN